MYRVAIITIGDELLNGQVVNTNVAEISELLTEIGALVVYHSTVGDNYHNLVQELDYSFSISDFVITTGGLGPTEDDITKQVIADYFNDNLRISDITLENIRVMVAEKNRQLNRVHYQQAEIPSKSIALINKVGSAPGIYINESGRKLIALPGVPAEMKYLMTNEVLPIIRKEISISNQDIIKYKTIITAGTYESHLAELIGSANEYPQGISLAYLPSAKGVRLRIGAVAKSFEIADTMIEDFERKISSSISQSIIGYGKDDLMAYISKLLFNSKLTVSVAESCTGGLLGAALTSVSGSSVYFAGGFQTYSNSSKINLLKIPEDIIDTYGAVSYETAILMAKNVKDILNTDIGIAITGIAGPNGGSDLKPVGTVYIGYSDKYDTDAKKFVFSKDRALNRDNSVTQALLILRDRIIKDENSRY